MATTSKSTPPPAETKRTTQTGGDATQRFTSAYADWNQQQQEISVNYQRQCSDAYFQLMNDVNEITAKAKRPVEEAHLKLMLAGPTANVDQDSWQKYQQLQQDYNKALADFQSDQSRQEAFQKAYENYNAATQKAQEEAQNRMTRSNQEYLKVLKEAWSGMNVENLSPTDKHAIQWSTKMAFQVGII
jgi:hypothetical protein